MKPDMVLSISQPASMNSKERQSSLTNDNELLTSPKVELRKTSVTPTNAYDKVELYSNTQQKNGDQKVEKTKENNAEYFKNKDRRDAKNSNVQFVYDQNGDLSVRYLDASNHLIYQVPSKLMMQMREAALKSETSVDTKA